MITLHRKSYGIYQNKFNEDLRKNHPFLLGIEGDDDLIYNTYKIRNAVLNYYRQKFNDKKEVEYNNQIISKLYENNNLRSTFKI